MLAIERIDDLETCKKVAISLERECTALLERNQDLLRENARLRGTEAEHALLAEMEKLQRQAAQLQAMIFGASSERRPHEQEDSARAEPKLRKGHGPRAQPELPVREVMHELPEAARHCEDCGKERAPLPGQSEVSEEITVIRRSYEIVRHARQKYVCQCLESPVVTAPAPPRLIAGGRYSVEFGVEVAADKYLNHLPLDRQRKMMAREGLEITTQTLWDQVELVADALRPTHEALRLHVLSKPLVHADETRWKLLVPPKTEIWHAWGIACHDAVCYQILPGRSAEERGRILDGYRGVVMVDGYVVYKSLARGSPDVVLAHCWAHARRKYVEIEQFYPDEVKAILGMIRELYAIEHELPPWADLSGSDLERVLQARREARREHSAPVTARILEWVKTLQQTRETALRKAVEYMTAHWAGLTRFLDDPRVPLDNNLLERSLRPIALGRKNHLGSKSERGIEAAAILYSVIESAKLSGVEPRGYLLAAVRAALATPRRVLLPHELKR